MNARDENDVGNVVLYRVGVAWNEWKFVCEAWMAISLIWCASDLHGLREVE